MKSFSSRCINLLVVVAVLFAYNTALTIRAEKDENARLTAELENTKIEWEADRLRLEAAYARNEAQKMTEEESKEEELGLYLDGSYTGSAQGFGGLVSVEVTVEGGEITDISVTSAPGEDGTYLSMAKGMISVMIEEQTSEVNTVSGATFSSKGIKNAVAQALEKAER